MIEEANEYSKRGPYLGRSSSVSSREAENESVELGKKVGGDDRVLRLGSSVCRSKGREVRDRRSRPPRPHLFAVHPDFPIERRRKLTHLGKDLLGKSLLELWTVKV